MSSDPPPERPGLTGRYTPRLDALGQVQVQVLSQPSAVTLREISLGGFSLDSADAFASGTTHRFRFTLDDGPSFATVAECVYSNRLPPDGRPAMHRAGFEFVRVSDESSELIAGLVYQIAEFWDHQPESPD